MSSPPTMPPDALESENRLRDLLRPRHLLGSALGPFLGLVVVVVLFSAADAINAPRIGKPVTFPTVGTVQDILKTSSKTGVAALGMTIIIISGGIDLSAGTAMALCATVTAWFFRDGGYDPAFCVGMGLLTGCLTGLINGALISTLRIVPFIVTLGTMTIYLGAGLILANNTPIRAYGKVPDWLLSLQKPEPDPQWLIVSTGVWVMAALALFVGAMLKYSVFGRYVFALGSNESTARLCGIDVTRQRILVYTIAGFFVGVAGLYQFANLSGEGDPSAGTGKELEVIAAVVIGGGSLNGGRGSILGTISGALIMESILNGCVALEIPSSYQKAMIGIIIIAVVTLDQIRQRRLSDAGS